MTDDEHKTDPTNPAPTLTELAKRLVAFCWVVSQDETLQHALREDVEPIACDPETRFVVVAIDTSGHVAFGKLAEGWSPEQEQAFFRTCAAMGRTGWLEGVSRELD